MAWFIVPQVIKIKGVEVEVEMKRLLYFPKTDKRFGNPDGFGKIKDPYAPWQVLIAADGWKPDQAWRVKISPAGNYSIVYNEYDEPLRPGDRNYPGIRHVVNQDNMLSMQAIVLKLMERTRDANLVNKVIGMLHQAHQEYVPKKTDGRKKTRRRKAG
jgi:hypothetical protein